VPAITEQGRHAVPVLLALLFASVAAAQAPVNTEPLSRAERDALFPTRAQIAEGKQLADAHCASCHGAQGIVEDRELPNLAAQRTVYLYRRMQAYRQGNREVPGMHEGLQFFDDAALLKAAIYFSSLEHPARPEPEPEGWLSDDDPLRAVRAATAGCGSCHGAQGNSRIPGMPSLTAQHPDYFSAAMQAYQGGTRTHNMMQMLVSTLKEETIRDMGLYYALQEPQAAASTVAGNVDAGRVAAEPCASCHGFDGNAEDPTMPTLAGQDAVYLVAAMQSYLGGGRDHGPMQSAMAESGAQDIKDMAAFYSAQLPRARPVRAPLATREWLERCARCHGEEGNSPDPRHPSLAGQNAPYFERAMRAYANQERRNRVMHAMSEPLSDTDIGRLAEYFAARVPDPVIYIDLPCAEQESD